MCQSLARPPCNLLPPALLASTTGHPPTHSQPPSPAAAGQGGVLSQEVDQLKRMLKAGANWDVISQMMSYISDKAAQVGAWVGWWAASGYAALDGHTGCG